MNNETQVNDIYYLYKILLHSEHMYISSMHYIMTYTDTVSCGFG